MSEEATSSNPGAPGNKPPSYRGRASTSTRKPSEDAGTKASLRAPSTDGPHPIPQSSGQQAPTLDLSESTTKHSMDRRTMDEMLSPMGPATPNPFGPRAGSLDLDDYFVGPFCHEAMRLRLTSCRLAPGISGSTPNGPSSCACTEASCPR